MKKNAHAGIVLFLLLAFHLAWLVGIWITGASENLPKLLIAGGLSLFGYLAINLSPEVEFEKVGNGINWLANNQTAFLRLLTIVMLVFGILYASQQRVWPFDEERNFGASRVIAEQGLDVFFDRYAQNNYLANRHPPLIFIVNGLVMTVFGSSLLTMRIVTLMFGIGALMASYFLASSLYDKKIAVLTVLVLLTYPLIFRESTAGLLDVQATLFFVLTLYVAWKLAEKPSWKYGVVLGFSLGLGLLTKYMVMFIIPLLFLLFIFQKNIRALIIPAILSLSVAGALFLVWTWYGSQIGVRVPTVAGFSPSDLFASKQVVNPGPSQSGPVIEDFDISPGFFLLTESGRGFLLNSLITRLPSALGAYNLPLILLGAFVVLRQKSASNFFVLMWLGVVSLLLVLTLPDHRYFMVVFPAVAMISARWLETQSDVDLGRVTLLMLFCQIGSLYIFVDWKRATELFIGP